MTSLKINMIIACAALGLATGCGQKNQQEQATTPAEQTQAAADTAKPAASMIPSFADVAPEVKQQLNGLLKHYLALTNHLVASNGKEARKDAGQLLSAIDNFDTSKLSIDQQLFYKQYVSIVKNNVQQIAATDDLKPQRESFAALSQQAYTLVKAFGSDQPLYYQYCPMARNDQGAYWLSAEKQIRNPYFGDEMLECGITKEELAKK